MKVNNSKTESMYMESALAENGVVERILNELVKFRDENDVRILYAAEIGPNAKNFGFWRPEYQVIAFYAMPGTDQFITHAQPVAEDTEIRFRHDESGADVSIVCMDMRKIFFNFKDNLRILYDAANTRYVYHSADGFRKKLQEYMGQNDAPETLGFEYLYEVDRIVSSGFFDERHYVEEYYDMIYNACMNMMLQSTGRNVYMDFQALRRLMLGRSPVNNAIDYMTLCAQRYMQLNEPFYNKVLLSFMEEQSTYMKNRAYAHTRAKERETFPHTMDDWKEFARIFQL